MKSYSIPRSFQLKNHKLWDSWGQSNPKQMPHPFPLCYVTAFTLDCVSLPLEAEGGQGRAWFAASKPLFSPSTAQCPFFKHSCKLPRILALCTTASGRPCVRCAPRSQTCSWRGPMAGSEQVLCACTLAQGVQVAGAQGNTPASGYLGARKGRPRVGCHSLAPRVRPTLGRGTSGGAFIRLSCTAPHLSLESPDIARDPPRAQIQRTQGAPRPPQRATLP